MLCRVEYHLAAQLLVKKKAKGKAKKEEEVHDDDTLAVSKVVKDAAAAAAAAALNVHSFVPGIDAVAVAALGALDDPIVQQAAACIDKPKLTDEI